MTPPVELQRLGLLAVFALRLLGPSAASAAPQQYTPPRQFVPQQYTRPQPFAPQQYTQQQYTQQQYLPQQRYTPPQYTQQQFAPQQFAPQQYTPPPQQFAPQQYTPPPQDDGAGGQPGVEVQTRGPLHEAFAEPVVFNPTPGPVVPKSPPAPVEEAPPDQKPEGSNVQWIPGYWAWDESRNDFLWISGLWRDIPPGRQWIPGYWGQDAGGIRWVPGAWVAAGGEATSVEYLSAPPASLEAGPNSPAPSAGAVWSPGYWFWENDRYAWRPGFWVQYQPDWVWVPAHYVWSPAGYMFVDGYWDRPLGQRGMAFAPVYFSQPVYQQPQFVYTPTIGLLSTALVSSLFVRPAYHQYYFGDYYAANNVNSGIYPSYSFNQSRYGYDPIFSHYSTTELRRDPQWLNNYQTDYQYRRDHPEARPAHTYHEFRRTENRTDVVNTVTNVNQRVVNVNRNLVLARPLTQMATDPRLTRNAQGGSVRFTRVDEPRREEIRAQNVQIGKFREERLRQELAKSRTRPNVGPGPAGAAPNVAEAPRRQNFAMSPISAAARPHAAGRVNVPATAGPSAIDANARANAIEAARVRHQPNPDVKQTPPGTLRDDRMEANKAQQAEQQQRREQAAQQARARQQHNQEMQKAQQAERAQAEQQRQAATQARQAEQARQRQAAMQGQQAQQEQRRQEMLKAQQAQQEQRRQEMMTKAQPPGPQNQEMQQAQRAQAEQQRQAAIQAEHARQGQEAQQRQAAIQGQQAQAEQHRQEMLKAQQGRQAQEAQQRQAAMQAQQEQHRQAQQVQQAQAEQHRQAALQAQQAQAEQHRQAQQAQEEQRRRAQQEAAQKNNQPPK